jgi:integrase
MSSYFKKGKGWRFDFTLKGIRYTETWFKTKKEAAQAEAKKREELKKPTPGQGTPTDTDFLTLLNRRLDHVKAFNSESHYRDYCYMGKRWFSLWGKLKCREVTIDMVERFILSRAKVSAFTANKEIRYLRATFNYGIKKQLITSNPAAGLDFLPVEKRVKYVPPVEDVERVISLADPETRDYLIAISDTMARVSEINRLTWADVDLAGKYVILYTRKKRNGHLTPRKVPMTNRLYSILTRRHAERDKTKPWVFWHSYFDRKEGETKEGLFKYRKRLMKGLCQRAGVKDFRFHALRHAGASLMDLNNVPITAIQRLLGHENRATTEIYLHSLEKAEFEAMRVLEHARENSHTDSHTKEKGTQA